MSVRIILSPRLQEFTGGRDIVEVTGRTIGECLDDLVGQFTGVRPYLLDDAGNLLAYIQILGNQEGSYPEELAKPVKDGDDLYIVLQLVGG